MSTRANPRPPPALGPKVMAAIGRELRGTYAEIIAEGVPEPFAEILVGRANQREGDSVTPILRKQHAQERIEGREPTPIGRRGGAPYRVSTTALDPLTSLGSKGTLGKRSRVTFNLSGRGGRSCCWL